MQNKKSPLIEVCSKIGWCKKIIEDLKKIYGEDPVHGFPHIERVFEIGINICRKYSCDENILFPCILLHDIGRPYEKPGKNHAIEGAKIAERILKKAELEDDIIQKVKECIASHSFSGGKKPDFLEAQIMSDADKIDAIGAVGVARAFIEGYKRKRGFKGTIRHFLEKLIKLKDLVVLEESKKIAEQRHQFLVTFMKQFCSENKNDCVDVPREFLE